MHLGAIDFGVPILVGPVRRMHDVHARIDEERHIGRRLHHLQDDAQVKIVFERRLRLGQYIN